MVNSLLDRNIAVYIRLSIQANLLQQQRKFFFFFTETLRGSKVLSIKKKITLQMQISIEQSSILKILMNWTNNND